MSLGVFYTCFTEQKAVEYSLKKLFEVYPEIPVYLVSDGGLHFDYLENKDRNLRTYWAEDTRGIIPKIPKDRFQESQYQKAIKKSIFAFLDRISDAIVFCKTDYILIMEPDVLVRGELHIPEGKKLLGTRINSGLSDELKQVLFEAGGKMIDNWGATPAILHSETFKKAWHQLRYDPELLNKLCLSDYRLAFYDVLLAVLFALVGEEEVFNPEIVECFRNPNWETSSHPLLHQYRAKYPLSTEGYSGTHTNHRDGLGDRWLWNR